MPGTPVDIALRPTTVTITAVFSPSSPTAGTVQSAVRETSGSLADEQHTTISYTIQGRGECGDGGGSIPMVQTLVKR